MIIIVATDEEFTFAKEHFSDKYKVIQTGVAGPNVIESLADLDKNEPILNLGFAGSNNIDINTVVKINDVALYHSNCSFKEKIFKLEQNYPKDIVNTILSTDQARKLIENPVSCFTNNDFVLETAITEPVVFDMELVYILALGFKHVSALKIVSDKLCLHEYESTIAQ